jgi:hypothetical protein
VVVVVNEERRVPSPTSALALEALGGGGGSGVALNTVEVARRSRRRSRPSAAPRLLLPAADQDRPSPLSRKPPLLAACRPATRWDLGAGS